MSYFKNSSVNLFYWILPFCFTIPFLYTVSLYCFPITILSDLLRLLSILSPRPYWSWYCRCYCLLPTACCLLPDRGSPSGEFYASFKPFPSQGPSKGSISWRIIPRVWCLFAAIFPVFNAFCNNLTQKGQDLWVPEKAIPCPSRGGKGKSASSWIRSMIYRYWRHERFALGESLCLQYSPAWDDTRHILVGTSIKGSSRFNADAKTIASGNILLYTLSANKKTASISSAQQ